jgi:peptidoglycan/xylan/chitin deacetylase (PgdA/CDA1 family)
MNRVGHLVISLDFELYWGVRDKRSLADYRDNLLGVRQAIPAMLRLFERFGIHATWATVGLLFCSGREDALRSSPQRKPSYTQARFSPYADSDTWGSDEQSDPFHFAPSLIDAIARTPHQEIASHTFSHFYCLESGQDVEQFDADLAAAVSVAARRGIALKSIVFPRNQVNPAYLPSCARAGLRSYRGTLGRGLYAPRNEEAQSSFIRGQRLLDNYVPLTRDRSISVGDLGAEAPYNVAASSFLRPHTKRLALLEGRRLQRIVSELTSAAAAGRVYHLWWHPHNFGRNLSENMSFLTKLFEHYSGLRSRYGMQSVTMHELATDRDRQLGGVAA